MTAYKSWTFFWHGFQLGYSYKINFFIRYISAVVSVLMFYFMDRLVSGAGMSQVEGASYFAFLLIGGTFTRFLELCMYAFALNLREEMLMGTLEPMLVSATPPVFILLGPSAWGLVEGTAIATFQFVLGMGLGANFTQINWLSFGLIMFLSLVSVISFGIISASFLVIFKRNDPVSWFVRSVAQVFSGVYFPITVIPLPLRLFSYILPFTYSLHGLRAAMTQGATLAEIGLDVGMLILFTLVSLPLSVWALRRAVAYLQDVGELAHY